jgi:hypothetical protein
VYFDEVRLRGEVLFEILEGFLADGGGLREFAGVCDDGFFAVVIDVGVAVGDGRRFLLGASGGLGQASSVALSVIAFVDRRTSGEGERL